MKTELKAPSVGESITEVRISSWKKQNGEAVKAGDVLIEIESDKATVEVVADNAGVLFIATPAGETVKIGAVLGFIDSDAKPSVTSAAAAAPAPSAPKPAAPAPAMSAGGGGMDLHSAAPSVRRIAEETGVNPAAVAGTGKGGRVTKGDMLNHIENGGSRMANSVMSQTVPTANDGRERRVPMTMLRQKIAERLVFAQHTSAILTTFNECDMSKVMELRAKYKEEFKAKYGVGLGFMSFFTRAVVEALKEIPAVNAMIDGKDVIYRDYYDIGVAVGTERGLVVPVMRDVGGKSFADIEKTVAGFGEKAKAGKLSIADLTGGTFTISNGGTYGSLLSTPILNPPQSGILGMHKIQERPMAVNGQVVIRPMMYLALSYDHRMIDGKEAVTFLVRVKEGIENPVEKLGFAL